ncbi:hypothetical protein V7S43_014550 [Phytophthora oleae]|uniref:Uncharacterized protein n=1 Tax=Phytophthora oleae TaxID=2107226 RepID=A0ABD3F339_9STRA
MTLPPSWGSSVRTGQELGLTKRRIGTKCDNRNINLHFQVDFHVGDDGGHHAKRERERESFGQMWARCWDWRQCVHHVQCESRAPGFSPHVAAGHQCRGGIVNLAMENLHLDASDCRVASFNRRSLRL